jgi:Taurine catabolism dioxygenase TauD, TfdA family
MESGRKYADFEPVPVMPRGPFDLGDDVAYREWRDNKLREYPSGRAELIVEIGDSSRLTLEERAALSQLCRRANMAFYRFRGGACEERKTRRDLLKLGSTFGLVAVEDHRSAEADGIVKIEVVSGGGRFGYIPYTDRAINWHTDGYYNYHGENRCVQAMLLHCARSAAEGGVNRLLDHEIAYIRLRDANVRFVEALMHPQAMTIPVSIEEGGRIRPENVGPVFFVNYRSGALGMRFTARKRNIVWRDDAATREAVAYLEHLLEFDPLVVDSRLEPGEGVICNNVLHDRTGFAQTAEPGEGRLLYRVRYHGRIGEMAHLAAGERR